MSEYIIHYYGEKDLGLRSGPKMCIQVMYTARHLVNLVDHLRDKTVIGKILDVEFKMDVFRKDIVDGNLLVTYRPGYNPSGSTKWFNDVLDIIDIAEEPLISITSISATGDQ